MYANIEKWQLLFEKFEKIKMAVVDQFVMWCASNNFQRYQGMFSKTKQRQIYCSEDWTAAQRSQQNNVWCGPPQKCIEKVGVIQNKT